MTKSALNLRISSIILMKLLVIKIVHSYDEEIKEFPSEIQKEFEKHIRCGLASRQKREFREDCNNIIEPRHRDTIFQSANGKLFSYW